MGIFVRSASASSFLSDYTSSPSPSFSKKSNSANPSQKAKKRKVEEYDYGENSFLDNFNKTVDLIVSGDNRPSPTNELLKEVLDVIKNTMNNDSAIFLKSLQSSLECFESNPKVFNTVKIRLMNVISEAMNEVL